MIVKYSIELELDLDVEISKVQIGNNGIGAYEYCGRKGFDKGKDFVESFTVESISVRQKDPIDIKGELFSIIKESIFSDESLPERIMEEMKHDARDEKAIRAYEDRERK